MRHDWGDLYLVPATPLAERFWLDARNDPDAVRWSRVAKPIDANTHHAWYVQALKNPKRRLFLLTHRAPGDAERRIGIARLDHRGTWTELSLVLLPLARGRGLGVRVLQLLSARIDALGWPTPGAIIHGGNRRSLRTFLKAGFGIRARRWIEVRKVKKKSSGGAHHGSRDRGIR